MKLFITKIHFHQSFWIVYYCSVLFLTMSVVTHVKAAENDTMEEEAGISELDRGHDHDHDQHDKNSAESNADTISTLKSLKNVTDELRQNFDQLEAEQSKFAQQVELKLEGIKSRLDVLEMSVNRTLDQGPDLEIVSRLHRQHAEELRELRTRHENLSSSVANIYHHVHHLTTMHNISSRLEQTAQLLIEERFNEASLHWTFVEKHTFDEDDLEDYLKTVILLAYGKNKSHLIPIFKFVHQLSFQKYKVYAYETLVNLFVNDKDTFCGTEVILLAQFVQKSYGFNAKGNSKMPELTKIITRGSNVKLIYFQNYTTPPTTTPPTPSLLTRVSRSSGGGGNKVPTKYVYRRMDQDALDLAAEGGLEVHTKSNMVHKRQDNYKSYPFPVYASTYGTFKKASSSMWKFIYQDNGLFVLQNAVNDAYLNVPHPSDDDQTPILLNTVPQLDTKMYNLEFKLFYKDNRSIVIESSAFPNRPLVAVPQTGLADEENAGSRNFCFKVADREGDEGARFTVLKN